jgi:hypothetical protein
MEEETMVFVGGASSAATTKYAEAAEHYEEAALLAAEGDKEGLLPYFQPVSSLIGDCGGKFAVLQPPIDSQHPRRG